MPARFFRLPLIARVTTVIVAACVAISIFVIYIGYSGLSNEIESDLHRAITSRAESISKLAARTQSAESEQIRERTDYLLYLFAGSLVENAYSDSAQKWPRKIFVGTKLNGAILLLESKPDSVLPAWVDSKEYPEAAEPMAMALAGFTGTFRYVHNGDEYVSAVRYLPNLKIALVSTAIEAEARSAYVKHLLWIILFTLAVIMFSTFLMIRSLSPFLMDLKDRNASLVIEIERRQALEKELRESNRSFKELIEQINDTVYEVDAEANVTYISPVVTKVLGYDPKEVIGKSFAQFIHPDDLERTVQQFYDSLAGNSYSRDIRVLAADGSLRWISSSARPFKSDGIIQGVRGIFFDITHQKHAELALEESERILRTITNSARDAVLLVDGRGIVTFWNPAATSIFGYTEYEAVGRSLSSLIVDNTFMNYIEHSLDQWKVDSSDSGLDSIGELEVHRKTGEILTIESSVSFAELHGERFAVGIFRDVTSRKKKNALMKVLSLAVERSDEIVFMTDTKGVFTYVNPAFSKLYGYESNEVVNVRTPSILKGGALEDVAYKEFWRTISSGGIYKSEFRNRTKQGTFVTVEVCVSATIDERGELLGYLALQRDVTDRKAAEAAIRQSEAQFRAVVETINEGLIVTDVEGRITYVNPRMAEFCGSKVSDVLGKSVLDYVAPHWRDQVAQRMRERIDFGHSSRYEIEIMRADGGYVWVQVGASPWKDSEGRTIGTFAVLSDVSDRKHSEEVRANLENQLRQAQKMEAIGTLAGGIAHDFNNILTPIIAYTDLVLAQIEEESQVREDLQKVMSAAQRAKELVKQILTFSRQTEQTRYPLQVSSIVKEALKLLRASLPSTIEIVESIEQTNEIIADPTQIHQIILNLSTNAFWAMKEYGGKLIVTLEDVEFLPETPLPCLDLVPGKYVRLTIRDTGCGMSPDVLSRVFEPFFTTKSVGEGTGLGLPVVHGIVTSSGGSIRVESEPGVGTSFEIYFPSAPKSDSLEQNYLPEPPHSTGHLLVIDDEAEIAAACSRALERYGYHVTSRTSSQDALDAFVALSDEIDAVVTDFTMPHMTGLQLARKIRAYRADIPIIVMTGYSPFVNESNWKDLGFDAFVPKPIVIKELASAVYDSLNMSKPTVCPPSENLPETS